VPYIGDSGAHPWSFKIVVDWYA